MTAVLHHVLDTVAPAGINMDHTFDAVLAYRDGDYRWPAEQARRFREAGKLIFPITVTGSDPHIAQVADREKGDLTAVGAARWARERNALHHDATVYVDLDNVPGLVHELGAEPCWLWIAWWNGKLMMPTLKLPPHIQVAAIQYQSLPDRDMSAIVAWHWPAHPFTNLAHW